MDAESALNAGQAAGAGEPVVTPPPGGPPAAPMTPPNGPSPDATRAGEPTPNGEPTPTPAMPNGPAAGTTPAEESTPPNGPARDVTSDGGATPPNGPALGTNPAGDASPNGEPAPTGTRPDGLAAGTVPTIYDVARSAGVSIASVSRVLNGRRNPRPETRDRVLQAVAELGFIPDGAARALSVRLKEVAGVIIRLPWASRDPEDLFADEEDSLQFPDMINRGIAGGRAAPRFRHPGPFGRPGRARPRWPHPDAGPQERRDHPARPGAGTGPARVAGPPGPGGHDGRGGHADDRQRAQ